MHEEKHFYDFWYWCFYVFRFDILDVQDFVGVPKHLN